MNPTKKVAFYTLGCKLNFSETSTIARNFKDEGFERVDFKDPADIYVINTCSVTENADKRFKNVVKQAQKHTPNAVDVASGLNIAAFNIGIALGSIIGGSVVESMTLRDTAWIGAVISALAFIATRYSGLLDKREIQRA